MRRLVSSAVVLVLVTSSLAAQGLRERISELFIFTAGKDPLFLGGTADPNNPATPWRERRTAPSSRSSATR